MRSQENSILLVGKNFNYDYFRLGTDADGIKYKSIIEELALLRSSQQEYFNSSLISTNIQLETEIKKFRIFIFCEGIEIKEKIEMDSYRLLPIKYTLECKTYIDAINNFFDNHHEKGYGCYYFNYKSVKQEKYSEGHPLFVIEYKTILANNSIEAINTALNHANQLFSILAYYQERRAEIFAYYADDLKSLSLTSGYYYKRYSGLKGDAFLQILLPYKIDMMKHSIDSDVRIKYIIDNYSFSMNEDELYTRIFKLWALMEYIAKTYVTRKDIHLKKPSGEKLVSNGKPLTTNRDLHKVYHLLIKTGIPSYPYENEKEKIFYIFCGTDQITIKEDFKSLTLWEVINMLYGIRNAVAHNGTYRLDLVDDEERRTLIINNKPIINVLVNIQKKYLQNVIDKLIFNPSYFNVE